MSEWISVKERLPERYKPVLVHKPLWTHAIIAFLRDDGVFSAGTTAIEVTHWMPLPSTEGLNDDA